MSSFMAEPTRVLRAYVRANNVAPTFDLGFLSMALEIITRIKLLETLPVTTDIGRQEAISCLQTMLTETGVSDLAYEWYDALAEWRKPRFRSHPRPDRRK